MRAGDGKPSLWIDPEGRTPEIGQFPTVRFFDLLFGSACSPPRLSRREALPGYGAWPLQSGGDRQAKPESLQDPGDRRELRVTVGRQGLV